MVTRVGGLASGMDIDSIIEKLLTAEKAPLNKLEQQKQKYEWQRDAYRNVTKQLDTFDTYLFDNFRLTSSFNKKIVNSTNSNLVTATATSSAVGNLNIEGVLKLATSASKASEVSSLNKTSDISNLVSTNADGKKVITLSAIQADGSMKSSDIEINNGDTVEKLVTKINNSGVNVTALFENGKLSISANNGGDNQDGGEIELSSNALNLLSTFNFTGLSASDEGNIIVANNGSNAVAKINGIVIEKSSNTFSINGYNVSLKETFNEAAVASSYYDDSLSNLGYAVNDLQKEISASTVDWSDVDSIKSAIEQERDNRINKVATLQDAYNVTRGQAKAETVSAYNGFSAGQKEFIDGLTEADYADVAKLQEKLNNSSLTDEEKTEILSYDLSSTISSLNTSIKELKAYSEHLKIKEKYENLTQADKDALAQWDGASPIDTDTLSGVSTEDLEAIQQYSQQQQLNSTYDGLSSKVKTAIYNGDLTGSIISKIASVDYADISADTSLTDDEKAVLNQLTEADYNKFKNMSESDFNSIRAIATAKNELDKANSDATKFEDTVSRYNNYLNSANDANSLGTTPTTNSVATVTLSSTTDIDNMVSKIKEFVDTYNGLIASLNEQIQESKYRDYQPLTDAQKEEMTEDEIEKWESKSKSGILRSDSTVTSGLYAMRNAMIGNIAGLGDNTIDSLAELGITTSSDTTGRGKLVIDEDKLRAAIEKNPDQVTKVFTQTGSVTKDEKGKTVDSRGIAQRLRDELDKVTTLIEKKAGKATSSTNQSFTIGKRLVEIEDRISAWKTKLEDIESRYWKQFTAMETAINKANSQSSLFQTA